MVNPAETINEIGAMLANLRYVGAKDRLMQLITSVPERELGTWVPEIRAAIDRFLPNRRTELNDALAARLGTPRETPTGAKVEPVAHSVADVIELQQELRQQLSTLSEHYIFQWTTAYRDAVGQIFLQVAEMVRGSISPTQLSLLTIEEFKRHATEIWSKGFTYLVDSGRSGSAESIAKSLSGLQRFLELPVEPYNLLAQSARNSTEAKACRVVCSSILTGILEGYGAVYFEKRTGWEFLAEHPRIWAQYIPLFSSTDLDRIRQQLPPGTLRHGIDASAIPLIRALDLVLARGREGFFCLPSFGQFFPEPMRLDISIPLPKSVTSKKYLEAECFLGSSSVTRGQLEEAARRHVTVVIAPLSEDIHQWVDAQPRLRGIIIDTASHHGLTPLSITQRAVEYISDEAGKYSGQQFNSGPLTHNFAKEFPLHSPSINRFFLVHRESVRRLLRSFERRNGVRLWCSVRRSGKTTACFDLSADGASDLVIQQSCDNTEAHPGGSVFYDAFEVALSSRSRIPNNFFTEVINQSSGALGNTHGRTVFVLDEYETLFERMRHAVRFDPTLRYTLVQPLLNQMVAFSRENLLIFIGQRPDAHFIIMDQNQLSPYVQQDLFPLFEHQPGTLLSEFRSLLQKTLTDTVTFDTTFADAVFQETAGHPFLTVNLMEHFFEWMIDMKRPANRLSLTAADLHAFSEDCLTPEAIAERPEYTFFLKFASESLSGDSRRLTPWLFTACSVLKRIAEADPKGMALSRDRYNAFVHELGKDQDSRYHPEELMRTAKLANFFAIQDGRVAPRIPLMARIMQAAQPRVCW